MKNIFEKGFFATMPIWLGAILYAILGYFIYRKGVPYKGMIVIGVLITFINFLFIQNWFAFAFEEDFKVQQFPELALLKSDKSPYNLEKDKVLILDLWSTSCGSCIEKFPDYEKLNKKYANNKDVKFYTLNLPIPRDSVLTASKIVAKYEFETLFAADKSAWKTLGIKKVPQYLIVNKDAKIVYRGRLHDKWYHFYNNIDHLIAKHLE
ncbi:TlpA family protein disulfide reductase [Ascidiimonas sp. W6]|uniref:TlpA family protein disulfide reductase n=1 Tax=Ascidiimonas meishanensis TaxID=3128903 RepID=UPI0030ED5430